MTRAESEELIGQCGGAEGFLQLFDYLPMVRVYAKDYRGLEIGGESRTGRFFYGNRSFCEMRGLRHRDDLLGTTDYDYAMAPLAAQYVAEDLRVFEAGVPAVGRAWLVTEGDLQAQVWKSSKVPIFDSNGAPVALIGAMYAIKSGPEGVRGVDRFTGSLVYIQENLGEKLPLETLAKLAGYSVSRYVSKFKEYFGETPGNYIKRMRVIGVASALVEGDRSAGELAQEFGFYDSSHLTRHFKDVLGVTPRGFLANQTEGGGG